LGLDICGIDIMAPDVSTPLNKNGGAVLEVNAAPGLRMHISPEGGRSKNVGDPIVDLLFSFGRTLSHANRCGNRNEWKKQQTSRLMAFIASKQIIMWTYNNRRDLHKQYVRI